MGNKINDNGFYYVVLSRCSLDKDGELIWDTEQGSIGGFNPTFSTVRIYDNGSSARKAAVFLLAKEMGNLISKGYSERCSPKTIDVDNHDWRRIARFGKEGKPSICLQVMIRALDCSFDPFIY